MTKNLWIWVLAHTDALTKDERAASMVEYAVLIAILVLAVFVALEYFSNAFLLMTNYVVTKVNEAVPS